MKLFYRISIFCAFILLSCFLTWAITSWFYSNQNKELSQKGNDTNRMITVTQAQTRTTCDTEYIMIEQNLNNDSYETLLEKIPDQYIDKTREQLIDILKQEEQSPVLSEREKGICHIQLSTFSPERIVVIRQYNLEKSNKDYQNYENDIEAKINFDRNKNLDETIDLDENDESDENSADNTIESFDRAKADRNEGFYLVAYDDKVYVYHSDMKHVYLVTNISIHDLPEQVTQEILDKKYIKDEVELYNFLESYSS